MPAVPVAFYAPLKSPDHPVPSGDRTVARLLIEALGRAGLAADIASGIRTFEPAGDESRQRALRDESKQEADALLSRYRGLAPERCPRLWFTYHSYYKAPDHLGPVVARALDIPYVIAEASRAEKRATGPWSFGHRAADASFAAASVIFVSTGRDQPALQDFPGSAGKLVDLPPFLDAAPWLRAERSPRRRGEPTRLLAVGMMRPGDKHASYRLLAAALGLVPHLDWTLTIVGDGPARPEVEALFSPFAERIRWLGEVSRDQLPAIYAGADLFVWPAVNEAYGMALLEAQAAGTPVVAGAFGGVASAMVPGRTGLMPPAGDAELFAAAVAELIVDRSKLEEMSKQARAFIASGRDIESAAHILHRTLRPLLAEAAAA